MTTSKDQVAGHPMRSNTTLTQASSPLRLKQMFPLHRNYMSTIIVQVDPHLESLTAPSADIPSDDSLFYSERL